MKYKSVLAYFFLLLFISAGYAQEKPNIKFGTVTNKDFSTTIYSLDSNANAVVIADIGSSKIEGNSKGGFSLVFKHFRRVHILNKNGYDAAKVSMILYDNGTDEEELDRLKAATYNIENGKVIKTELNVKTDIYKVKLAKNFVQKNFTFPNVKEGSVIEFEYTKKSDFFQDLEPWEFQGDYPCLWSEYNFSIPDFLGYVIYSQGYMSYDIKDQKTKREMFRVVDPNGTAASDHFAFESGVTENRWVIKNVPTLKEENFTSTLKNHTNKIEFQLSEYREPYVPKSVMTTWPKAAEDLMKAEFFGEQLTKENGWLKDILALVVKGSISDIDKAKKIFAYIRDNFTCTDYSDLYLEQTLKSLAKTKSGTVAEINMLLCAMLRYEGMKADPVLLSTRSHGFAYANYPIMSKYNYVIVKTGIEGNEYFLDATEPRLGFGRLPLRCYNGHARAINETVDSIELPSKLITETKTTNVFVANDEKGNIIGHFQQTPGYYTSLGYRNQVKEKGKDELEKDIQKSVGSDVIISKFFIDSLDKYENEINLEYDFDMTNDKENIIYLNPMFGEAIRENPFKSAERFYPVEMPYKIDETYNLQMEVPVGYEVDEMPKPILVKLNEQNEGLFEYRISISGTAISVRSRIKMNRTNFYPDEYQMLREFFNLVVKKQTEQIVFKKKK